MDRLCEVLVGNLVHQGFDERQTLEVFETLEAKYPTQVSPARPKRHLRRQRSDVESAP